MIGGGSGAGVPPAPTLTGTRAAAAIANVGGFAAPDENSGVGLSFSAVADLGRPFTIAGGFANFGLIPAAASGANPYFAAAHSSLLVYNADQSYLLLTSLFAGDNGNPVVGYLSVAEFLGETTLDFFELAVPGPVEGVPFDLELVVDPVSATALARYTSGGVTTSTDAISLSAFMAQSPDLFTQFLGVRNSAFGFDHGAGDRASVDFTELRVDVLPEPSLVWLAMLALGALALRRH